VASVYNFAVGGKGTFTFNPRTSFLVEGNQVFSPIDPTTVYAEPFTAQITELPSRSILSSLPLGKRAINLCLDPEKKEKIDER